MNMISVVMCTYNGASYLSGQLDSLKTQSHPPDELVVCDDKSSDATVEIVRAFAASSSFPVKIIVNDENVGFRKNFIRATSFCSGDLIAFCDQDDIWYANKIERSIRPFADRDVELVYHAVDLIDEDGRALGKLTTRDPGRNNCPPLSTSPWVFGLGFTLTFRKSITVLDRLWDQSIDQHDVTKPLAHDQWYCFVASVLGTIVYIDESLAQYRQHESNLFGALASHPNRSGKNEQRDRKFREFSMCAASCAKRSAILSEGEALVSGRQKINVRQGEENYRKLAEFYEARAKLYIGAPKAKVVSYILNLSRIGAYRNRKPWSFGNKAILRDIYSVLR